MDKIKQFAANNAAWIDQATQALGIGGTYTPSLWRNPHDMPPIFPNADILDGTASEQIAAIAALVDRRSGRVTVVKDPWAALDLSPLGFEPLFDALWLYRDAAALGLPETDLQIEVIHTPDQLRAFSMALNGEELADVYRPTLLNQPHIRWLTARRHDQLVGGVMAFQSSGVVGINNLFGEREDDQQALLQTVIHMFPEIPICGYETEDATAPYLPLGFRVHGPLRIWIKPA
jgi:hypothetical protein